MGSSTAAGSSPPGPLTNATRWTIAVLAAYVVGFLLFPPRVLLILDEERYVAQAMAFAMGRVTLPHQQILYPPSPVAVETNYPPGTSLLQAPFVWAFGWRGAALLSVLGLVIATWFTRLLLRRAHEPEGFALLLPAFFGSLFFGRVAMSDMPSAALVAVSLWLFWRADDDARSALLAGLTAGLSLLLREPNVVLLAPFGVALLLKQRWRAWPLVLGALVGIGVRLIISKAMFGDALYVRPSGYGFSIGAVEANAARYALILIVMFPLGAVLPFFYRGPKRAEVVTAFAVYALLFVAYEYDSGRENGPLKGLILASRFMVPVLPLLVLMSADVLPRWIARLRALRDQRIATWGLHAVGAVVFLLAFAIHPLVSRQEAAPLSITRTLLAQTRPDVPIVTNHRATLKYFSPAYGQRLIVLRSFVDSSYVAQLQEQYGRAQIALLDRTDSDMFREDARENEVFVASVRRRCELRQRYSAPVGGEARMRVYDVSNCSSRKG